jgi:hypothetical protein
MVAEFIGKRACFTHVAALFGSVAAQFRMTLSITLFRICSSPIDMAPESESTGAIPQSVAAPDRGGGEWQCLATCHSI